jgi:DNA-binding SARP family transcriptional activator
VALLAYLALSPDGRFQRRDRLVGLLWPDRPITRARALRKVERDQHLTEAGKWARRAARHAWTDEWVLRRAMTMLERLGDRAGAVKLYEGFAARLRADLEVEPSAETNALVESIHAR